MMSLDSLDYSNYFYAMKSNYRKGVNRLRALLMNPVTAKDFAASVGGVSVVLGWPVDTPDRNSAELLEILGKSSVVDAAVLTWFSQFYPEYAANADTLFGDVTRCEEILNNPLLYRGAAIGSVSIGKMSVSLAAGLNPADYADMTAVAASSTAMTAVAASSTAMTAVAASSTAMTAVAASSTAMMAIEASNIAIGKYAVGAAGLNPAEYADMTAVAASSTAMTAVAASSTAMTAVAASSTAMTAVAASSTAMTAVAASSTAMTAVAASSTAMTAVAASAVALNAILKNSNARGSFAGSAYLQDKYSAIEATTNNTTYFNKTAAVVLDSGSKRAIGGGSTDATATPNQSLALIQKMGSWSSGMNTTTVIYHLQTNVQVHSVTTTTGPISGGTGITASKICIGGCKMTETGDGGVWGVYVYAL